MPPVLEPVLKKQRTYSVFTTEQKRWLIDLRDNNPDFKHARLAEEFIRSSEMSKLALEQVIAFGSLNDAVNLQDFKMMLSRQLRWPITCRLVAQSCWCELQANTITSTLTPKCNSHVK